MVIIINFFIQEVILISMAIVRNQFVNLELMVNQVTNLVTNMADFVLSFIKLINLVNLKELQEVELTIKEVVINILAIIFMTISNQVIRQEEEVEVEEDQPLLVFVFMKQFEEEVEVVFLIMVIIDMVEQKLS